MGYDVKDTKEGFKHIRNNKTTKFEAYDVNELVSGIVGVFSNCKVFV